MGIKRVKIIHGHDERSLKRLVREYLKESPYTKSFHPRNIKEEEDVTLVE
ncbi:Smr/MutS family protein [Thermovibrio sp.]